MKSPRLYIMLLDLYPIHKNEFFSTGNESKIIKNLSFCKKNYAFCTSVRLNYIDNKE